MPRLLFAVFLIYLSSLEHVQSYKSADIPLYRKDTPYCMSSFIESGDFLHKEVWTKVTKEDKAKDTPTIDESVARNNKDDDYMLQRISSKYFYCPRYFNMTAIQVDLGSLKRIVGIVALGQDHIHGQDDPDSNLWAQFVSHYTVEFSPDGRIWTEILDQQGQPRHFKVTQHYEQFALAINRENVLPRAHLQTLDPNIHARFVRLNFQAYIRTACVRMFDLFGCDSEIAKNNAQRVEEPKEKIQEDQCSYMNPLGMESGEIKDHQIEASSYRRSQHRGDYYPYHARWSQHPQYDNHIWCADQDPMVGDREPWIRVRLSSWTKYVTFIRYKANIKGYHMHIELSMDGVQWRLYKTKRKFVWTRPYNAKGVASNDWLIPPEPARYVRFRFERSKLVRPFEACIKFEIYGCSAETQSIAYGREKSRRVPATVKITPTRPDREISSLILEGDPYRAWCARYKTHKVFLHFGDPTIRESSEVNSVRIDLTKIFAISRIIVQGDRDQDKGCTAASNSLSIMHSNDEKVWVLTRDYNGRNDFKFRTRHLRAVERLCGYAAVDIKPTIYGRYFRFIIQRYLDWPCLRIVLVGYEPGVQPLMSQKPRVLRPACRKPLGMEKGAIRDKQITASSYLKGGVRTEPRHGRLKQDGGWCVAKMKHFNNYYALNDSLEIDLTKEYIIDGFATQGHASPMQNSWVTGYLVHYSLDGISWAVITMREQEKMFLANKDPDSIVRHYLNPRIRARKIRFVPVTWNKWVCMRAEIYGCDDGTSMETRLEKKLREVESRKLALVPLVPKTKVSFDCGDYETWGHTNYLKVNLDKNKSTWYQKAYNEDFKLVEKRLTLATNQFPNDFGSRHFMCVGRTRDGMELFWQHLIAAPSGPQAPTWLSPNSKMTTMDSSDVPQIIVIQRFDPAYDGGIPVWSEPATVYASGNIGQIAIYVIGIPYYPITIHNCLIENRLLDWHFTILGEVPKNDYRACARLALSRGYEYMSILGGTNCLSSWYLPLATSPHRLRDKGQCRLYPEVFFINATFEEYQITWSKKNKESDDDDRWIKLQSYTIKPRLKTSPHIATIGDEPNVYTEKMKRFSDGGRYRTFDKPLFGDTYTGSHVMEIMDMTVEDLGSYKFEVFVPSRGVRNEATIELRHEKEPQIELPVLYQACENVAGPMTVKEINRDLIDPEAWTARWFLTIIVGLKIKARYSSTKRYDYMTTGLWNETFTWTEPDPYANGENFEVFVENRYGFATGLAQIEVFKKEETPAIKWITPSPFEAIEGINQILEVKITNEKQLESVKWYHDDKPIESATDRYGLPESSAGVHKKLKLIKIDDKSKGKYKVVVEGKACRFERTIEVKVIVIPRVFFNPREDFIIAKDTDKEVIFNATVKGGNPKPKIQQMSWKKGSKTLMSSYGGRIALYSTLDEHFNWFSVLKIRQLRSTDSGEYSFELVTGPALTKKTWRLSVRSTTSGMPTQNTTIATTAPQSGASKTLSNLLCHKILDFIIIIYYFVMNI